MLVNVGHYAIIRRDSGAKKMALKAMGDIWHYFRMGNLFYPLLGCGYGWVLAAGGFPDFREIFYHFFTLHWERFFTQEMLAYTKLVFGCIVLMLILSAALLINDYYDLDIDKVNPRRKTPLTEGIIDPKLNKVLAILFIAIALPMAAWMSASFFIIAVFDVVVSVGYTDPILHLKYRAGWDFIANGIFAPVILLLGGWLTIAPIQNFPVFQIIPVIIFSGLMNNMVNSALDFESDSEKFKSFGHLLGSKKRLLVLIAVFGALFAISSALLAHLNYVFSRSMLPVAIPLLIASLIVLLLILRDITKNEVVDSKIYKKIYMKIYAYNALWMTAFLFLLRKYWRIV